MDTKTLKTLEFDKILDMLAKFAVNESAKSELLALQPSSDCGEVERRLAETDHAVVLLLKYGAPDIGRINEVKSAVRRMELGGALSAGELLNAAKILRIASTLSKYYSGAEDGALGEYFKALVPNKKVESLITSAIIAEDEIADSASPALSSIRRKIKSAEARVKSSLNDMLHSEHYKKMLQDFIVTVRDGRYVIPVKAEYRGEVRGIVHDVSSSGGTVFIEPSAVVNANNEINELTAKERNEIERILFELTSYVLEISEDMQSNYELIILLDGVFAKAKFSVDIRAMCPRINKEGKMRIKNGRHPLIDRNKVVPSNVNLGYDFDSLIVTGPNTGGKTVVLKTIGLFCLMAQSGLHIPADDGSEMPVFDSVFADIGDEQSIEQSLSTFSAHMKNIVYITENVTAGSLVLFDELGAGTDPTEGAALATSVLEYVKSFGAKTVATTHYSELKLYALSADRVENASCEFDVETLSPTYRLLIGIPGKSNAFAIAQKLGLSPYIIENSKKKMSRENIKFEDVLSSIEENRQTSEREKDEAERLRAEIEELRRKSEKEHQKIMAERDKIISRAEKSAERIIERAQEETDKLIGEIKAAQKARDEKELRRTMQEVKKELNIKRKNLSKSEKSNPQRRSNVNVNTLKLGDTVIISELNDKGIVSSINKKDETAVIQVGIMKITSKISGLVRVEEQPQTPAYTPRNAGGGLRRAAVKSEIDLRGRTLEDALLEVDKFIDDACLAGLPSVTVIHGKGTGTLRAGIHDLLRHDKRVKEFRLGKYGEGENGVTVVTLK